MVRRIVVLLALVGLALAPTAALADSHVSLDAELTGWSGPAAPAVIRVTAASDVLWSGHLRVALSAISVFESVELPAGSEKDWEVIVPPTAGAARITVTLVNEDKRTVARKALLLPAGGGGPQVAVLGGSVPMLSAILDARSTPVGNPPTVTEVTVGDLSSLGVFDYLAVGAPLDDAAVLAVQEWVTAGGRVIGEAGVLAALAGDAPASEWGEIRLAKLGRGEIVTIRDDRLESPTAWGLALREVGGQASALGQEGQFGDPYRSLGEAANGSGNPLALIPWLLSALGIYVVVVGPANLLVLRRLKRPELGWVTIPALALLGVLGLWFFGPRQSTVIAHHATIVVDGEQHVGVSLIASNPGLRSVSFADHRVLGAVTDADLEVVPLDESALGIMMGTGRAVTVYAQRAFAAGSLDVEVEGDHVTLTNNTGVTVEQWGLALGSMVLGSTGELAPGAADELTIEGFINQDPWDPLLMQKLWEDPNLARGDLVWRAYRPLLGASELLVGGIRTESFAWALTSRHEQEVGIDGKTESVEGIALFLSSIDIPPERVEESRGRVLSTEGLRQEGPFFLWGLGSAILEFAADQEAEHLRLRDQFSGFGRTLAYSLYNPTTGDWDLIGDTGTSFEKAAYVTPTGVLYVRIATEEDREIDLQGIVVEVAR